jgi:bis(5'-nucleosidyl)-tetraphosphatase
VKYEKSCGAMIYRRKNGTVEYLVVKSHEDRGDWWGFPKGHSEEGESECETAQREIQEETKLKITTLEGFREQIQYSPSPGVWKTVVFFIAELSDGQKPQKTEETADFRWLPLEKAYELLTFKDTKELLNAADTFIKLGANGKKNHDEESDDEL